MHARFLLSNYFHILFVRVESKWFQLDGVEARLEDYIDDERVVHSTRSNVPELQFNNEHSSNWARRDDFILMIIFEKKKKSFVDSFMEICGFTNSFLSFINVHIRNTFGGQGHPNHHPRFEFFLLLET